MVSRNCEENPNALNHSHTAIDANGRSKRSSNTAPMTLPQDEFLTLTQVVTVRRELLRNEQDRRKARAGPATSNADNAKIKHVGALPKTKPRHESLAGASRGHNDTGSSGRE